MGATPSSCSVEETKTSFYSDTTVLREHVKGGMSLRLYKVTSNRFEAILHNPEITADKAFSLFTMPEEEQAKFKFSALQEKLSPLFQSSAKCYELSTLQKLVTLVEQHPDWSQAHIASHLGLTECLENSEVAATIDNACSDKQRTPLHMASRSGKKDFVQSLMQFDPKLLVKDKLGNTPLHYAAEMYPEVLGTMLQKAQDLGNQVADAVNSMNNSYQTPLEVACSFSQDSGVKVLLEAGADASQTSGHGQPIHTAMNTKSENCAAVLLEFHPELINSRDKKYGGTPLHWAKTKTSVELLLISGADIEAKNNEGESPLHTMCRRRRLGCVIGLLASGAQVDSRSDTGLTPLHTAVVADDPDIVRALIVFGANVNALDKNHQSALHKATAGQKQRWHEIVRALGFVGAAPCGRKKTGCKLECSKPFQEKTAIGETPIQPLRGLEGFSGYEELIKLATAAASLKVGSHGIAAGGRAVDATDGRKAGKGQSVHKALHKKETVLTMDGGGIRGLVLIQLLLAIEEFAKRPIADLFDWIGGTSTGGILALALVHGKSAHYCQGLYFKMKDLVFQGPRPYDPEPLEKFLRQEFGEQTLMTSVTHPKVLITGVLADRRPASLYFFKNYELPEDTMDMNAGSPFPAPVPPSKQQVWRAARGTGAAPTFFRAMGRFLDGGLIANNPTLDVMTEIHKFHSISSPRKAGSASQCRFGVVVSLGTGVPPPVHVSAFDVFKPESLWDAANVLKGAQALGELLVDQATATHGPVVERARAWCQMLGVPYFRLSSPMSADVGLDETDDRVLVKMLWETRVYVLQNLREFKDLAQVLTT